MKTRTLVFVLAVAAASSGCAFSAHKPVPIHPEVSVAQSTVGANNQVWVDVVDERPKSTLGTRGVQGVGTDIGLEGDIRVPIRNAIVEGLKREGFSPVDSRPVDGRELRVEIRNLDYTVTMGFWAGSLETACGLKAVCILGDKRPFEELFRGEFKESVQVVQTEEANERYINAAVTKAVNLLLGSDALMQCLASPPQN